MTSASTPLDAIIELLGPFNSKSITLSRDTSFAHDLELDSLSVMDFVAEMEDHFDIMIPLNILPDLENVGQIVEAVEKIVEQAHG
jgi:acyl carrier protein